MFNGNSGYGSCAGNSLGASIGNGTGWDERWHWLFGVHPIQDRAD